MPWKKIVRNGDGLENVSHISLTAQGVIFFFFFSMVNLKGGVSLLY